jgi:hypothetical protein
MAMTCGLCGLQASSRDDAGTSNGPGECNASALMQLRFASLVVINLREDLHLQECAGPGAQKKPQPRTVGVLLLVADG